MARPRKENAEYHSHDADMRNDDKILALRAKFNNLDGYAVYNMMLEVLTDADKFERRWDETNIILLAGDFRCEPKLIKDVVDFGIGVGLFQVENGVLFSQQHKDRLNNVLSRRTRRRSGETTRTKGLAGDNDVKFEEFEQERQEYFNNLDEEFRIALKENMGIERPYIWANRKVPVEYFDLVDFIIRIRDDAEWRAVFCRNNSLNKTAFLKYLYMFIKEVVNGQLYYKYEGYSSESGHNNFIGHFSGYVNKKL